VLGLFEDATRDIIDTYQYDDYGNVISKTDALGNITTLTYNEFNNLTESLSPLGIRKKYLYDPNNNVTSSQTVLASDAGPASTGVFNSLDHPTEEVFPIDETRTAKIVKTYDGNENVTEILAENGTKQVFEYDEFDRVAHRGTWAKDADGDYRRTALVSATYDRNGNVVQTKDLKDFVTAFEYDGFDRLVKSTDGLGNATVFVRDRLGRETETRTYDASNVLVSKINSAYNSLDSVIRKTSALVDANGTVTETQQNAFAYDKNGKLVRAIDARGGVSEVSYDEFGRAVTTTDALGNMTKSSYDKRGLLVKKEFWNKGSDGTLALKTTDTAEYDAEGRLTRQTNTDGKSKAFEYNKLGQITKGTDEIGNSTDYAYDYTGKKLSETSYRSGVAVTLRYAYDTYGNNVSLTDEKGRVTHYEYDALGRLAKRTYPDGSTTSYEYDALGDLVKKTDPNGNVVANAYDVANRLVRRDISPGTGVK
jgi:YD repeat-containing protein